MSIIFKVIIVGIVAAFLSAIIKKTHPEFAVAISIAASFIIFYFILDSVTEVLSYIKEMMIDTNIDSGYIETILKIIAIAYLSEYTGAILEDAGETAIAKKVEMAGKVIIFIITIPVLKALLDLILSII